VKFTQYFLSTRQREDRVGIQLAQGRYLRVVLLQDGETVHNAFFDRSFTP
jgi:hypothetical protein